MHGQATLSLFSPAPASRGDRIDSLLDGLVTDALGRNVSRQVVRRASAATRRFLVREGILEPTPAQRQRATAYFAAVVRRGAVRRGEPSAGAERFVIASLVADLRESGRDGEAIWEQLSRGWGDTVDAEILEEFRLKLCG